MKKGVWLSMVLAMSGLEDQWGRVVVWENFESLPRVLIFGGRHAGEQARDWGILAHKTLNSAYTPGKDHLEKNSPQEKVKVLAIASLPNVPGMFKGLFRSGFRSEVPNFPMVLDFAETISKAAGYEETRKTPCAVWIPAGIKQLNDPSVKTYCPPAGDLAGFEGFIKAQKF